MQPRRGVLAGLAAATVVSGAALAGEAFQPPRILARETYDTPGRLVRLPDGRKLNLRCLGQGSPTVILESGFGVGSYAWAKVEPRIATVTRVCAYDRAGYGFSDPGPLPRDGQAIARDLERGLKAAGVGGPYVLVGHSAGGLYQRLFAARHRRDVVGMVFVDTSIEHQMQRLAELLGETAGSLDGQRRRPARCLELVQGKSAAAAEVERLQCAAIAGPGPKGLADRPATWNAQLSELDTLFTTTSDEVDRTGRLLRDIPVIVLTAAKTDGPPPEDPGAQAWQYLHRRLAASFRKGDQRLVKSSHLMMNDRPEVVAGAAIELVEGARKR